MTPTITALQSDLSNALSKMQAAMKAFEHACSIHGEGADEVLSYYTAMGDTVHYMHQQMQQCIDLGYVVRLTTESEVHRVATLSKTIFVDNLIKFSFTRHAEYLYEGLSLNLVKLATIEE